MPNVERGQQWSRRAFGQATFAGMLSSSLVAWGNEPISADAPAVILVWLNGGPSHIDSFDPKPGTTEGGPFTPIASKIVGVRFTECLPKLAAISDKLTLIRSLSSQENEHTRAQYFVQTGFRPGTSMEMPGIGSLLSVELAREAAEQSQLAPAFVGIAGKPVNPGYLGASASAFVVFDPRQRPENVVPPAGQDSKIYRDQLALLEQFETQNPRVNQLSLTKERAKARRKAVDLMHSPSLEAFDLRHESEANRERFGKSTFGQSALLARRLVEAGSRFVHIHFDGWDTHTDNFERHRKLLGELDVGMSALLADLSERSLLSKVLVVCLGEFGRTPKINPNKGRDHYSTAFSALLAGRGVRPGAVHGQTNLKGSHVIADRVLVPDLLATVCQAVGVDHQREVTLPNAKPVTLTDKGKPITAILS